MLAAGELAIALVRVCQEDAGTDRLAVTTFKVVTFDFP